MLLHKHILLIVLLVDLKFLASLCSVYQHRRNAIVEGVYDYSLHTHSKSIHIRPCPEIENN